MRRQLIPALVMLVIFTVICGLAYPLLMTGVARTAFADKADGSLVSRDGKVVGSEWIGQTFTKPEYFHSRPSAAGDGYDGGSSSGSSKGPTNPEFLRGVKDAAAAYRTENGLSSDTEVPADAVTASASGLDPDISVANARMQAKRVADARGITEAQVLRLVTRHTDGRGLGFMGEPGVNVLELNLALDQLR